MRRLDEMAALYGRTYRQKAAIVSDKLLRSFFLPPSFGLLFVA